MKLSRNKIRKIRKQQHQSVRKWKKQHKSSGRRTTFRQSNSRRRNLGTIIGTYPSSKLNSVINRTLKNYIPRSVMAQIKENYRKMRRKHRKQKHYKMTGGADDNVEPTFLPLGTTDADTAVPLPAAVPESSVAAADPSTATSAADPSTATSATATSAAALADSYTVTVSGVLYDDWYLPSKDELNQMCKWARGITGTALTTLTTVCTGGTINTGVGAAGFAERSFGSSSESDADKAWFQGFVNGNQSPYDKSYSYDVRPVRAF